MSVETLRPYIQQILSAPGIDLATISAKRVRKQLREANPSLSELLKNNKDEIDQLIGSVFQEVSESAGVDFSGVAEVDDGEGETGGSRKRKYEEEDERDGYGAAEAPQSDVYDDEEEDEEEKKHETSTKSSAKGKKGKGMTDEEYARQLSQEINGRERKSRAAAPKGTRTSKKGTSRSPKKVKSAARVHSSGDESEGSGNDTRPAKKKKRAGGGGAKGGFAKEFILSEPLSVVVGTDKLSRPQVVKALWAYIRGHDLQNPSNKKEILCDTNFRAVFNCDKIDMFKMNKVLGQHLHEES